MYFVYILKSLKNGSYYKGFTNNISRRISEHNSGKTSSNKKLAPFKLIHVEICQTREEARKLEKFFKTGYGREIIREIGAVVER